MKEVRWSKLLEGTLSADVLGELKRNEKQSGVTKIFFAVNTGTDRQGEER